MIGRIRGEILEIEGSIATIDAGGVGYEVVLPDSVRCRLGDVGDSADLYTRQIIREDAHTLYGFLDSGARRLFDLLLSVNGCGPKVALALLGQVGEDAVAVAISTQDAKLLTRASGVGAKLAERIILELKDKVQEEALRRKLDPKPVVKAVEDELVDALVALGYRRADAVSAADRARETSEDLQEQIVAALQILRR